MDDQTAQFILQTLRDIEKRQIDYVETVSGIKGTLENGLKKKVDTLCDDVKRVCGEFQTKCDTIEDRLIVLEEFAWFRKLATKLRDNSLYYGLLAFVGGVVALAIVHAGDAIFTKAIAVLLKAV